MPITVRAFFIPNKMAFEIELINGVTKYGDGNVYNYLFTGVTVVADVTNDKMIITNKNPASGYENPLTVDYDDITDKLGSVDIAGYVDALAIDGYFA